MILSNKNCISLSIRPIVTERRHVKTSASLSQQKLETDTSLFGIKKEKRIFSFCGNPLQYNMVPYGAQLVDMLSI